MHRQRSSVWTDLDALQRLAGIAQQMSPASDQGYTLRHDRPEFRTHSAELPLGLASGDYVDAFLVAPQTLALVMGDVAGKGAAAAVVRNVTQAVVRNVAPICGSPGELLSRLERILHAADLGAMFVTLWVGWYTPTSGRLRYANAGHPVPYRVAPDGAVDPCGVVTGPILGILGNARFQDADELLAPGERLVLFTDGVTEASDAQGNFFGAAGLVDLLHREGRGPLDRLCDGVIAGVNRFRGSAPQDDVSVLALERTPAA
jgi:sigma-B regulation protein RsbU (phosphoserine phosphatase)